MFVVVSLVMGAVVGLLVYLLSASKPPSVCAFRRQPVVLPDDLALEILTHLTYDTAYVCANSTLKRVCLGLRNSDEVETLFPLYDALAEPRACITELRFTQLDAKDLLGLRWFPHLRSLHMFDGFSYGEIPAEAYQARDLPHLTSLLLSTTGCRLDNAASSFLITVFGTSLKLVDILLNPYSRTPLDLSDAFTLNRLTLRSACDPLEQDTPPVRYLIRNLSTSSRRPSPAYTPFRLVLTTRYVSSDLKDWWHYDLGTDLAQRIIRNPWTWRIRAMDATKLGMGSEIRDQTNKHD
ncbi:hypothetical protein JCM8547_005734 [Rhodosporidiobolus lusitaniae]